MRLEVHDHIHPALLSLLPMLPMLSWTRGTSQRRAVSRPRPQLKSTAEEGGPLRPPRVPIRVLTRVRDHQGRGRGRRDILSLPVQHVLARVPIHTRVHTRLVLSLTWNIIIIMLPLS